MILCIITVYWKDLRLLTYDFMSLYVSMEFSNELLMPSDYIKESEEILFPSWKEDG